MARKPVLLNLASLLVRLGAEEDFELDNMLIVDAGTRVRVRDIRIHAVNHGGSVMITGSFAASAPVECSRCLTGFDVELSEEIEEAIPIETGIGRDQEEALEATDEYDAALVSGSVLDVTELIRQQVVLATPMLPLCSETCEGLCPHCGEPLRICGCAAGTAERSKGPETGFGRLLANALKTKDEC